MTIDPSTYPSRAFILFTAQNQLLADLTGQSFTAFVKRSGGEHYVQVSPTDDAEPLSGDPQDAVLDEAFFEEIATTAFNAHRYPELYQSSGTQRAAKAVEARIAAELVETYKQIKLKKERPIVQSLNNLL